MKTRFRGRPKLKRPAKPPAYTGPSIDEIIREARQKRSGEGDYRERSLKIHGLICAKCGREFTATRTSTAGGFWRTTWARKKKGEERCRSAIRSVRNYSKDFGFLQPLPPLKKGVRGVL